MSKKTATATITVPFRATAMCNKIAKADILHLVASTLNFPDAERITPRMIGISKVDAATLCGKAATAETFTRGMAWLICQAVYGNMAAEDMAAGLTRQVAHAVAHAKSLTSGTAIFCADLRTVTLSAIDCYTNLPEKTATMPESQQNGEAESVAPVEQKADDTDLYGIMAAIGKARNTAQQVFAGLDALGIACPDELRAMIVSMVSGDGKVTMSLADIIAAETAAAPAETAAAPAETAAAPAETAAAPAEPATAVRVKKTRKATAKAKVA